MRRRIGPAPFLPDIPPVDKDKPNSQQSKAKTVAIDALHASSSSSPSLSQYRITRILSSILSYLASKIVALWNYCIGSSKESDRKREIEQKDKDPTIWYMPGEIVSDFDKMMRPIPNCRSPGELNVELIGYGTKKVSYEPPLFKEKQSRRETELQISDFHSRLIEVMPDDVRAALTLSPKERAELGLKPGEHPWFNLMTDWHTTNGWKEAIIETERSKGIKLSERSLEILPLKTNVIISMEGFQFETCKIFDVRDLTTGVKGEPVLVTVKRFIPMSLFRKGNYASSKELAEQFHVDVKVISEKEIKEKSASLELQKGSPKWMEALYNELGKQSLTRREAELLDNFINVREKATLTEEDIRSVVRLFKYSTQLSSLKGCGELLKKMGSELNSDDERLRRGMLETNERSLGLADRVESGVAEGDFKKDASRLRLAFEGYITDALSCIFSMSLEEAEKLGKEQGISGEEFRIQKATETLKNLLQPIEKNQKFLPFLKLLLTQFTYASGIATQLGMAWENSDGFDTFVLQIDWAWFKLFVHKDANDVITSIDFRLGWRGNLATGIDKKSSRIIQEKHNWGALTFTLTVSERGKPGIPYLHNSFHSIHDE